MEYPKAKLATRRERRQSTNYATIVPSLATWMCDTILAAGELKGNNDSSVVTFCEQTKAMSFLSPEMLVSTLTNGVVLVQLLNSIERNVIPHYNKTPKSGKPISKFKRLENLQMFLRACRSKFHLRDTQLFEATDLDATRNATGVISCLRTIQRIKPRKQASASVAETKTAAAASSSVVVSGSGAVSASTTSENQQEKQPQQQHARVATHLPPGWGKHHDPTYDQHYYFNDETESTSWVRVFCRCWLAAGLGSLIFFSPSFFFMLDSHIFFFSPLPLSSSPFPSPLIVFECRFFSQVHPEGSYGGSTGIPAPSSITSSIVPPASQTEEVTEEATSNNNGRTAQPLGSAEPSSAQAAINAATAMAEKAAAELEHEKARARQVSE